MIIATPITVVVTTKSAVGGVSPLSVRMSGSMKRIAKTSSNPSRTCFAMGMSYLVRI
jgi:hypothetical protein